MLTQLLYVTLCLAALGLPSPASSAELRYQVRGYSGRQAVVVLTGAMSNNVTTTVSSDGRSIRISGVGVSFVPFDSAALPSIIANVQQVKRGQYTDLVIQLAQSSLLSASPSQSKLELYIKTKESETTNVSGDLTSSKVALPFKIALPKHPQDSQDGSVVITLPAAEGMHPQTRVSNILHSSAYALDVIYAWINRRELVYSSTVTPTSNNATTDVTTTSQLSEELLSAREALASCRAELETRASN